jgi:hypothetical protein
VNQKPYPEPCPVCAGLVVAARGEARRCTSCGRAWDASGVELPEEEAKALVPKPRGGGKKRSSAGAGGKRRAARATGRRASGGSGAKQDGESP